MNRASLIPRFRSRQVSGLFFILALLLPILPAGAVSIVVSGTTTYNTAAPTSSDIANWTTGWGNSDVTGWNYVGTVAGASAVYLGNSWIITAAHVTDVTIGSTYTLDGVNYTIISSATTVSSGVDLYMYQISATLDLPVLTITSQTNVGNSAVMIGYGGGKSWGVNTITGTNVAVSVGNYSSTDFETAYGTTTIHQGRNSTTVTNSAQVVLGDSGGAAFTYNTTTGKWELTGVLEAVDDNGNSYMVDLSKYKNLINTISGVPEPETYALVGLGLLLIALGWRKRRLV